MAYAAIEPWGPASEHRADLRSGIVAATIANCNRDEKRRPEPFGPDDFMPQFQEAAAETDEDEDEEPTDRQVAEAANARFKLRMWAEAMSARFNANKPKT
jgi:hypothetical protein